MMIPLFKPYLNESAISNIDSVLRSGQLTTGRYSALFESEVSKYINNPYFLTISSNSIEFALRLLNIGVGDEVISSPMSCLASNQPILTVGAKVVWADIDPATGTLDPASVKQKITNKTKAILHFHWGGFPGYIDEIKEIGINYGLKIIEDATEAFGSKYKNKVMGSYISDICCFSFTGVRLPNAIDGYGVSFGNIELYEKAKKLRDYGIDRSTFRDELGEISPESDVTLNGQGIVLNNISSFIGLSQMDDLAALFNKNTKNSKYWDEYFDNEALLVNRLNSRDEIKPNYWVYTVNVNERDKLLLEVRKNGYYASKLHLRNDYYSVFGKKSLNLKGVDEFSKTQLNLPCGWWMDIK